MTMKEVFEEAQRVLEKHAQNNGQHAVKTVESEPGETLITALAEALVETQGRYDSEQDRARAIINKLAKK
jgi:hypothetical protein